MLHKIDRAFFVKALCAGLMVGLTGFEFLFVKQFAIKYNHLLASLLFPFGNTLIMALSLLLVTGQFPNVLNKQNKVKPVNLLIMFIFNAIGIIIIGLLFLLLKKTNLAIFSNMTLIAKNKFSNYSLFKGFLLFGKGILCGFFIYIGIFLYRLFNHPLLEAIGMWIPVFIYVVLGFNNGLTDIFYLIASGNYSIMAIIYIFIAFLGNLTGVIILKFLQNLINQKAH